MQPGTPTTPEQIGAPSAHDVEWQQSSRHHCQLGYDGAAVVVEQFTAPFRTFAFEGRSRRTRPSTGARSSSVAVHRHHDGPLDPLGLAPTGTPIESRATIIGSSAATLCLGAGCSTTPTMSRPSWAPRHCPARAASGSVWSYSASRRRACGGALAGSRQPISK